MAGEARSTTDHNTIKQWAEARGGRPARVKWAASSSDVGLLHIDFPGYRGADVLEKITWGEFFATFDEKNLALVYQEQTSNGGESHFFTFINRNSPEHKAEYSYAH